jgi:hypothetical protein
MLRFEDTFFSQIFIYDPKMIYSGGDGTNSCRKPLELLFTIVVLMHKLKINYQLTENALRQLESFNDGFQRSLLGHYKNIYIR